MAAKFKSKVKRSSFVGVVYYNDAPPASHPAMRSLAQGRYVYQYSITVWPVAFGIRRYDMQIMFGNYIDDRVGGGEGGPVFFRCIP